MRAKTQSFSDMIEMIGLSRSLSEVSYLPISFPYNLAAEFPPDLSLLKDTPLVRLTLATKGKYAFKDQFHVFNYSLEHFPTLKSLDLTKMKDSGFKPVPKNSWLNEKLEEHVGPCSSNFSLHTGSNACTKWDCCSV